jgi:hypothetical protein
VLPFKTQNFTAKEKERDGLAKWLEQTINVDAEPAVAAEEAVEDPPAAHAPPPKAEEATKRVARASASEATVNHPVGGVAHRGPIVVVAEVPDAAVAAEVVVEEEEGVVVVPRERRRSLQLLKSWMPPWMITG